MGMSPLLLRLLKKCSFMHKMCQIPHPHRRLRPLGPLLLATLSTDSNTQSVRTDTARGTGAFTDPDKELTPLPIDR